jgi:hypothetical protein
MASSRLIVPTGPRTRGVVLLAAAVLAGFASVQLPAITKVASGEKPATNGIYQCHPEPEGDCIGIKEQSACVAHPRCQWANDASGSYCRPAHCWT